MISKTYFSLIYFLNLIVLIQSQITGDYDRIHANEIDFLDIKYLPSVLHNDQIYLPILYKCSSLFPRRISLSITIEKTLHRTNLSVFRRHWFCQKSTRIQIRYVKIHLPRSLAYKSNDQVAFISLPIEQGQLKLIMYYNKHEDVRSILKKLEYNVRFLPVHQRPEYFSFRWSPWKQKPIEKTCSPESDVVRIVNYSLVMTGSAYGKHFNLPSYRDYSLRLEQQSRLNRPIFSIVFWLYIDEYCSSVSYITQCALFQHLTFNNTHLTPEIFLNREGQIIVHMYGHLNDFQGTMARTLASIPKKDWCRLAFIVNQSTWSIYINCLQTWNQPIKAFQRSSIYYYFPDEFGTYIIGGSDLSHSFRGFINQIDIYRRIAFTYEELPTKPSVLFFPSIISQSTICQKYLYFFHQSHEQLNRFKEKIQQKLTCHIQSIFFNKSNHQCLLIPTWKKTWLTSPDDSVDVRYRIFRALRREKMNTTMDVANQLVQLVYQLLETDNFNNACDRVLNWTEQAVCFGHPSAHSLLATFHQYGLCGLQSNSTRALELLLFGALNNDRISLLALGHRHFYGLHGLPLDYDAAYVYYEQMAHTSRLEFYNPKPNEVAMEYIRLTDNKLMSELAFDKSDVFDWLTQQARRGVASAQNHLGSLLYQGRNGITRNIQAAVEYFRLGAEQHDASSHFGYGLALLKGQGTKQNITEAIRHIEKAVEHGFVGAQAALGYHAYEIEKNYSKAAKYWKDCFERTSDIHCAHNLGVMHTAGNYPPDFRADHVQAWGYYSFAAKHGQIDSKIVVAYYNARGGHPVIIRNPWLAAIWSRFVAEESSAVGTIVRRALQAYRDRRWHTSFIFYLQSALAGLELGYFNAGYLCKEVLYSNQIDCVEQFLNMYLTVHGNNLNTDSYALLNVAEYYQRIKANQTRAIELYVQLYQDGDPQGLYNLAQMEENLNANQTIPWNIWTQIGVTIDENIRQDRYRKLKTIYQHCRTLKTSQSDESYIPCTLAYLRVSFLILYHEQSKILLTILLMLFSTFFLTMRR